MNEPLEKILLDLGEASDLVGLLSWLERAAEAATLAADRLGEPVRLASIDLRATVGAFVEFSRGPQDQLSLIALQLAVDALLNRALHTLSGAIADVYRKLGAADLETSRDCRELARLWISIQRGVARREPVRPETVRRIAAVRDRVDAISEDGKK